MTGVVFGATILAAATALPEVSTGHRGGAGSATTSSPSPTSSAATRSCRCSSCSPACSPARRCCPRRSATDIYLTALGIVLTVVYLWGLVTRPHRQVWRMGIDSVAVLLLYAAGIAGLIAVSNS